MCTAQALPIPNAVFDGEICAVDSEGRTRFQELQNALSENSDADLQYFIFDLLYVDGADIRDRPLLVRKAPNRRCSPTNSRQNCNKATRARRLSRSIAIARQRRRRFG